MHHQSALRFHKFSPGGNTTILVADPVPASRRPSVAAELMDAHHVHAEQVGFLTLTGVRPRIDMMGGEFCGNACRSLAALLAFRRMLRAGPGGLLSGVIESSGVPDPLPVRVAPTPHGPDASVRMPLPPAAPEAPFNPVQCAGQGCALIRLPGITHLLLDAAAHPFPDDWRDAARRLIARHGLNDEPAAGCIWHHGTPEAPGITPVVRVRDTDSIMLESACGSGSLAYGLYRAARNGGEMALTVRQPSGAGIRVSVVRPDGAAPEAWIGGPVRHVASGIAYLHACPRD